MGMFGASKPGGFPWGDFIMGGTDRIDAKRRAASDAELTQQILGLLAGSPGTPGQPMQGPGADGNPVGGTAGGAAAQSPMTINDPRLPLLEFLATQHGFKLPMDSLKAQQPNVQYDRGFGYDQKTGAPAGAYHPNLGDGMALTPSGVVNLPGYTGAAAQTAGAVEGAKSGAAAPYQPVQTFGPGGAPRTITATQLAAGQGGMGQSPAQNAADTAIATAGAQAQINLPQVLNTASQAIGLIDQMKAHPGLGSRVGWRGALPALPDTPGADFSAMQDQLKGKVFLEAFGQLKGAGQITEVEGQKATQAIARLNNTQTKQGYLKALDDLEAIINTGAQRAAGQTRLQPNANGGAQPRGPSMAGKGYRILSVE